MNLLSLKKTLVTAAALLGLAALARPAIARDNTPRELKHVGVDEHLGRSLPLDATFKDASGHMVRLGNVLPTSRPSVFLFAYHSCPVLCSMVQSGMTEAIKNVKWTVGREFDVIVLSIDPEDTPERARQKRDGLVERYGRDRGAAGWHFLTGNKAQIDRVAAAAGVEYTYDERQKQYAHPALVMLLTPDGRLGRYLYGLEFNPNDIRIGLLEASEGRSVSTVEKVILYCYHYDPQDGKYVLVATRVMQVGAGLTAIVLAIFLGGLWARERRRKGTEAPHARQANQAATPHRLDVEATDTP